MKDMSKRDLHSSIYSLYNNHHAHVFWNIKDWNVIPLKRL